MMLSDLPWTVVDPLLRRACADEWPYDPDLVDQTDKWLVRLFLAPDVPNRQTIGVEVARRSARLVLHNKDVKHFEIISTKVEGVAVIPHEECNEEGCLVCRGLGALLEPDDSQTHAYVMGWVAIAA